MLENSTTKPWPADKLIKWPIDRLVPYARNARTHTDEQVAQVAASIREWGWTNPILVGEDGGIIAGHCRVLAGRQLGLAEVPVMFATGWSEAQKRAYIIADNQLTLNAGWNPELLRLELGELQGLDFDIGLIGFDEAQLASLTGSNPGLTDPDEVPEPPPVPIAQPGEVWQLGRHRLMCGDATDKTSHDLVLEGIDPALVITDPPYGVGVDYQTFQDHQDEVAKLIPIVMPLLCRWRCILLTPGIPAMWMYPKPDWVLAWVHPAPVSSGPWGFNGLNPILAYGHDPHLRAGKGRHPDHLVLAADRKGVEGHPTPKPIEVWKWLLERGSVYATDHVFDPFVGSGTTIIAAEMTGRACHALEINPTYVDVAIERWQNFTGEKARKESA